LAELGAVELRAAGAFGVSFCVFEKGEVLKPSCSKVLGTQLHDFLPGQSIRRLEI